MMQVQLASWNIRKCVGLDRRRDPRRIARVLSDLEADIVVLQEADRRLGRRPAALPHWLVKAETPYEPIDAVSNNVSLGWHGNAVLLGPEMRCEDVHRLQLSGLEPRGALLADVSGRGMSLRIVAVHLGLLRKSRQQQLLEIGSLLKNKEPRPTVVIGDFNEWSAKADFSGLGDFRVEAPGRTFHSARPVAALDRVAVGHGAALDSASVIETKTTRIASDHLPITATVSVAA
ncbi:MAG: metal-dependent hydrolase [Boseongicola sp.]|nr:MAG: metal-dependent hydrolase [Boseongicola sp.]